MIFPANVQAGDSGEREGWTEKRALVWSAGALSSFRPSAASFGGQHAPEVVAWPLMSEPLCPRCANGMPCCSDLKPDGTNYLHTETCATYAWANRICGSCQDEIDVIIGASYEDL